MYEPRLEKRKNGIPVISKREIDALGAKIVLDFCPEAMKEPQSLDEEAFVQYYLCKTMDFRFLSHCGLYLGMTVFDDNHRVAVYDPEKNRAEYCVFHAGTIIIDNSLMMPDRKPRYRYTVFHEGSHVILHQRYFENLPALSDSVNPSAVLCRMVKNPFAQRPHRVWTDYDWAEWQANALASALLMPAPMVRLLVERSGKIATAFDVAYCVQECSRIFGVSIQAAEYRLKDLGYFSGFSIYEVEAELSLFAH